MLAPDPKRAKEGSVGLNVNDLSTPALVIDHNIAQRNAKVMLDRASQLEVQLRPHVKTHKTIEGALLQTGGSTNRIVVSTLAEANFFADGGFDDILYAFVLTPNKVSAALHVANKINSFHIVVDSCHCLESLGKTRPIDKPWSVWIMVDTGYKREGVNPADDILLNLANAISASPACVLAGLYAHDGRSYDCTNNKEIKERATEERDVIVASAERLRAAGHAVQEVAVGSTPSCSCPPDNLKGVTEMHPGCYLLYDSMQIDISSCLVEDVAIRLVTRVIGQYPDRNELLIDAGWTATTAQGKETGFGRIEGSPSLRIRKFSQETGVVASMDGSRIDMDEYPVGTMLRIIPYHACATCAMHSVYYITEDDVVVSEWKPVCGWS